MAAAESCEAKNREVTSVREYDRGKP